MAYLCVVNAENILNKTYELFFSYGIKSVSMDDISRELGISKKTIYTHFENKRALVKSTVDHFTKLEEAAISNIHQNASSALEEMFMITEYVLGFLRHMKPSVTYDLQKYYKTIFETSMKQHFEFIEETIISNLNKGIQEGVYRADINTDIIAKLYIANGRVIIDERSFPSKIYPKPEVFFEFISYHLHGIIEKTSIKQLDKYLKKLQS